MSFYAKYIPPSEGGGGTVTSITAGTGLTGGTITSSGTIALDQSHLTLDGSTSGSFTQRAADVTTSYSVKWPAAQGAASTFLQNDGAGNLSWVAGSGGANTSLSNLGTVSFNSDLLPSASNTRNIGSSTLVIQTVWAEEIRKSGFLSVASSDVAGGTGQVSVRSGNATTGLSGALNLLTGAVTGAASTNDTGIVTLKSGDNASANAAADSGAVNISSGSATAGNSGNIALTTGTSVATRGKIRFVDGTEGTSGYVWTSTDTVGSGAWMASGGSGANTTLSNLDSPVAFNQDLLPDMDTTRAIGSTTDRVSAVYTIEVNSGDQQLDLHSNSIASGGTGNVNVTSGSSNDSQTGNVALTTGIPGTGSTSGNIDLNTSATDSAASGHIIANTGGVSGVANSGNIALQTGPSDASTSGSVSLVTGGGNTGNTGSVNLTTGDSAGSGLSGTISLTTGEIDSGTSGSIVLTTGPGATRGQIRFKDGSEGTAGYIWTSTDTNGSGSWLPASGGGANQSLSNLTNPTAINQDLIANTGAFFKIKTKDDTAATQSMELATGDATGGSSGTVVIESGTASGGANPSGDIQLITGGVADSGPSGGILIATGTANAGASGSITQITGDSISGNSGSFFWQIGQSPGGNTGQFNLSGSSDNKQTVLNITNVNWNVVQANSPTLTAGANAGTSPTASFSGNASDIAGVMIIIPDTGVTAGEVLKLTYFGSMASGASVILTPANNNAATAEATLGVWADGQSDSTFFTVNTNIALTAGTTYIWNYLVMGLQ